MALAHVLAVVPVADLDKANAFYEAFFSRPADNNPMPTLVEWQVIEGAWVQVTVDPERAGSSMLNFAVDDLEKHIEELATRGIVAADIVDASKGVRLSAIEDPDGNAITLIGGFRVNY
ncbi:VOC family protein [Rhodococcus sp. BP-252]|uniref:VOC family protein n=1 Tax=unclassified Rhodococcus (in: high G+C Gram-positive bacteria) TaxID=192944 RepID=UPI0014319AAD|nr:MULTISPECIES: VOC family protein [unclassified Rhodococcus (in: high G+C Gram-positive bacteria)]MBY6414079.1 VOC family protein [Rhodococcus sp. BP-320]MBY6418850.1 VOC family protein [Rhodococcus sp. BP-321]MBY6423405.1 VOC family protein [Rhodococcus sp. BP-324]MBY6428859.1 VOC family protein [Rhodococcus sp. BP-323]MBY6433865.1 VOC family protein [Rhodococcus sp. BP-322]